jgi:hypothetical protein
MNVFRLEWEPAAEDELGRIWLRSSDPSAVTTAQAQVDRLLAHAAISRRVCIASTCLLFR